MKNSTKKSLIAIILITVISFSVNAQTNVGGGIFANTTWTQANSPYIVIDTVVVFPGFTLTIEPGVTVKFYDHTYIEIRFATLIANGTATDSITFTSNSPTPSPGIWGNNNYGGLWINSNLNLTSFNFCHIEYATSGIYSNSHMAGIKNSIFINNISGLYNTYSTQIDSCIIKFNGDGITSANGSSFNFCNISNNTYGIGTLTTGSMVNCVIDSNQTGLGGIAGVDGTKINNCTINYNQTGLLMDAGGPEIAIKNCIIDFNSILGMGVYGHGTDSVISCEIKFNGTGLIFSTCPNFGGPSVCTQNIIDNNTIGIKVGGCGLVYCNRFCNNTSYDLQNLYSSNFNAANNYWCTTDSATVEAHIYDGYDNTSLGLVSFMPPDTLQCYTVTGISTNEMQPASFSIFPNPADDYLTLLIPDNILKAELNIFNPLGELEYSSKNVHSKTNIDISSLANGIHILELSYGKNISRQKFIKQRTIR